MRSGGLSIELAPGISDVRQLKLPGYDTCSSEKEHLNYLHYFFAPSGTKEFLKLISRQQIRPLSDIRMNEITSDRGLFAWELTETGKRTFIIVDYKDVYRLFNYVKDSHLYEVIPEGRPCHLYFDCEFLFSEHPDWNGDALIARLIDRVDERLLEVFGRDEYDIVDLNATSDKKFSRHIIIRGHGFCFRDNRHVGRFVQTEIACVPELQPIIDLSVYSKNRCFRCIWSTKKANGPRSPLQPIGGGNESACTSTFEFFTKSLVCYLDKNMAKIGYPDLLPFKRKPDPPPIPVPPPAPTTTTKTSDNVEEFVLASLAPGGRVTKVSYNEALNTVNFYVEGTRFCRRIGREHKSNHIYLTVRLFNGDFVQKCTDRDCRGFESDPVKLPRTMWEELCEKYEKGRKSFACEPRAINPRSSDFRNALNAIEKELEDDDDEDEPLGFLRK